MITTPNSTQPPAMTGCDYTVRVDSNTWQCLTTEEYIAWEREKFIEHQDATHLHAMIGLLALVTIFGILLVIEYVYCYYQPFVYKS